jgi:hypothetical protein
MGSFVGGNDERFNLLRRRFRSTMGQSVPEMEHLLNLPEQFRVFRAETATNNSVGNMTEQLVRRLLEDVALLEQNVSKAAPPLAQRNRSAPAAP